MGQSIVKLEWVELGLDLGQALDIIMRQCMGMYQSMEQATYLGPDLGLGLILELCLCVQLRLELINRAFSS